MSGKNVNSVFYAQTYHPIQAGSIDGTDINPHDDAVYRAFLCSSASLYDPLADPNLIGDPYCTVFVARLSHLTSELSLRNAMSQYGRVKSLRLVRDIVTGASRGYAFVEYQTEREMRRAYKDGHHSFIDDSEVIVDYSRQQLMPGWIPRRLGGGLGGRKESGQLRFGGRERPFRAPLRPIPYDDLKRLGIPPPPEGRYMSRFQVPSPPRRKPSSKDRDHKRSSNDEDLSPRSSSAELEERYKKRRHKDEELISGTRHSAEREEHRHERRRLEHSHKRTSHEREYQRRTSSTDVERGHDKSSRAQREGTSRKRSTDVEDHSNKRGSTPRDEGSHRHHKHGSRSSKHKRRRSVSRDRDSDH